VDLLPAPSEDTQLHEPSHDARSRPRVGEPCAVGPLAEWLGHVARIVARLDHASVTSASPRITTPRNVGVRGCGQSTRRSTDEHLRSPRSGSASRRRHLVSRRQALFNHQPNSPHGRLQRSPRRLDPDDCGTACAASRTAQTSASSVAVHMRPAKRVVGSSLARPT
jgi:hypothetical protein